MSLAVKVLYGLWPMVSDYSLAMGSWLYTSVTVRNRLCCIKQRRERGQKVEVDHAVNEPAIAPHVTSEFQRYSRCGILEHGFVSLNCKDCQAERAIGCSY